MIAKQAREITEKNLIGPILAPMLEHVHKLIEEAAKKGHLQIFGPLAGRVPIEWNKPKAKEALWLALQNEGYQVTHHTDPDPGHPCSGPYTTVSW